MSTRISKILQVGNAVYDKILIKHRRNTEIKKFKDKRRVQIYGEVKLSPAQEAKIDDFYKENYGEKIPYTWHRYFTAYTGKFDVRYFPELLAIPEFERFMNPCTDYVNVFGDKNILPLLASAANVKMPATIVSRASGCYRDGRMQILSLDEAIKMVCTVGRVFIKPSVDSSSGRGCAILDVVDGRDSRSGKTVGEIFDLMGNDFVVQEIIRCHKSISDVYPGSVNTFRIITYRWNDKIEHCPVIMRIGRDGNFLDNVHAGGMFVAVEDSGALHENAYTEFNKCYNVHPNTGVKFANCVISNFDKVISAAKQMHTAVPQIGMVNWDFTVNEQGVPVMIEANTHGGAVWLAQMAHGKGIFGDKTAEILKYIGAMKKLTPKQRENKYWKSVDKW